MSDIDFDYFYDPVDRHVGMNPDVLYRLFMIRRIEKHAAELTMAWEASAKECGGSNRLPATFVDNVRTILEAAWEGGRTDYWRTCRETIEGSWRSRLGVHASAEERWRLCLEELEFATVSTAQTENQVGSHHAGSTRGREAREDGESA